MWRNNEVRAFVDWLRGYNAAQKPTSRVAFHGLDLYSLYDSIRFVLEYLEDVDPEVRQGRARTLRLSDALAVRSSHLRSRGAHRQISDLRSRCGARAQRSAPETSSLRRPRW